MPTELVYVLGAGGHGRVVIDALLAGGCPASSILVRDDRLDLHGTSILTCRIEAPAHTLVPAAGRVHAAAGSAKVRRKLLEQTGLSPSAWFTIIHPRAVVSASAKLEHGGFVAAQAVIGPCAQIGVGAIINHGAVVDHDCKLGDFCHVAPLASLGGDVHIGNDVLIGAGARILPGLTIGDGVIIGAGAVVLENVPSGQTWFGVPAQHSSRGP